MTEERKKADGPIIIKKYANRRLYNTQTSSYVTLDHLAQMVKAGTEFEVRDARSGEDITRSVLTQIIFEEEGKGQNLLPIKFLRQLIRFYGDSLQAFVPGYLEMSIDSFTRNQEALREKFKDTFGGAFAGAPGFKEFEALTRQNLAMFERAMRMFQPFAPPREGAAAPGGEAEGQSRAKGNGAEEHGAAPAAHDDQIRELKNQIEAMQRQIAELVQRK